MSEKHANQRKEFLKEWQEFNEWNGRETNAQRVTRELQEKWKQQDACKIRSYEMSCEDRNCNLKSTENTGHTDWKRQSNTMWNFAQIYVAEFCRDVQGC